MKNTILLVEDEEGLASYVAKELTFEDFDVLTAADGEAAWETYQREKDNLLLVLLDWMLPKMDGMEVLRRIRKHDELPVIMMTARDYLGDKVTGLDNGADDYITKPFEIEELLARIRVIQRRTAHQSGLDQTFAGRPDPGHQDAPGRPRGGNHPADPAGVRSVAIFNATPWPSLHP